MPRLVRPMLVDQQDNLPLVGPKGKCLGVRTTGKVQDVQLEKDGTVTMNRQGMSVSKTWKGLPAHLVPEHLDNGENGASGIGMAVFVHCLDGEPFREGAVASGLVLCFKQGTTTAGHVCPEARALLAKFQTDLAATRCDWLIDESE